VDAPFVSIDVDDPPNRKSDGHLMLDSVRSILFSGRADDAISGELAELLGFDELDLVSDILSNRGQFFEEMGATDEPVLILLPSKGKGKETGNLSSTVTEGPAHGIVSDPRSLAPDQVRRRMEEQLQANASRPLFTGIAVSHIISPWCIRVELKRVA
jgi:antiviral helicase SLH1